MDDETRDQVEGANRPAGRSGDEVPDTVTLKGDRGELKIRLVVPKSLGLRYELTYAVTSSEPRAYAAALGLCSGAIRKHVRWRHNVMEFGGGVLDWLLAEGVDYLEVYNAGRLAWYHVSKGLVDTKEVEETEGFSEAPPAGSTS